MTSDEWLAAGMLLASMTLIVLAGTFVLTRWLRPRPAPSPAWQSVLVGVTTGGALFVFGYVVLDLQRALWSAPLTGLCVGGLHYYLRGRARPSADGDPGDEESAADAKTEPS